MPIQIKSFTLSLEQGHAEPSSAFLSVFDGGRTFPGTSFYGIVDVGGRPDGKEAAGAQEVLRKNISNADRASLTGAMERAVAESHRYVWRPGQENWRPAVLCVAIKAGDLFVACRGMVTVLSFMDGQIFRPEFSSGDDEPWMERVDLASDEALILGNTTLAATIPEEAVGSILDADPDEAARRVYMLAREYPQVSALFFRAREAPNPEES